MIHINIVCYGARKRKENGDHKLIVEIKDTKSTFLSF